MSLRDSMEQISLMRALVVAENICTAVRAKELQKRSTGESLGRITVSIGAAEFAGTDTIQELIDRADQCMYVAKRQGRNRVFARPRSVGPIAPGAS
jgi:diguanylate cyclase